MLASSGPGPQLLLHFTLAKGTTLALQVVTPDVTPPIFTGSTPLIAAVQQTALTVLVQLNEPSIVFYAVLPNASPQPSIPSLIAGTVTGALASSTIQATQVWQAMWPSLGSSTPTSTWQILALPCVSTAVCSLDGWINYQPHSAAATSLRIGIAKGLQ